MRVEGSGFRVQGAGCRVQGLKAAGFTWQTAGLGIETRAATVVRAPAKGERRADVDAAADDRDDIPRAGVLGLLLKGLKGVGAKV